MANYLDRMRNGNENGSRKNDFNSTKGSAEPRPSGYFRKAEEYEKAINETLNYIEKFENGIRGRYDSSSDESVPQELMDMVNALHGLKMVLSTIHINHMDSLALTRIFEIYSRDNPKRAEELVNKFIEYSKARDDAVARRELLGEVSEYVHNNFRTLGVYWKNHGEDILKGIAELKERLENEHLNGAEIKRLLEGLEFKATARTEDVQKTLDEELRGLRNVMNEYFLPKAEAEGTFATLESAERLREELFSEITTVKEAAESGRNAAEGKFSEIDRRLNVVERRAGLDKRPVRDAMKSAWKYLFEPSPPPEKTLIDVFIESKMYSYFFGSCPPGGTKP